MLEQLHHLNELSNRSFIREFNEQLEELATMKFQQVEETNIDYVTSAECTRGD